MNWVVIAHTDHLPPLGLRQEFFAYDVSGGNNADSA